MEFVVDNIDLIGQIKSQLDSNNYDLENFYKGAKGLEKEINISSIYLFNSGPSEPEAVSSLLLGVTLSLDILYLIPVWIVGNV